jgi:hypothetical protein
MTKAAIESFRPRLLTLAVPSRSVTRRIFSPRKCARQVS